MLPPADDIARRACCLAEPAAPGRLGFEEHALVCLTAAIAVLATGPAVAAVAAAGLRRAAIIVSPWSPPRSATTHLVPPSR
ncbi:hypothetical protein [Amycolatopsis sp. lyj-346]|uniref:hypothetical protein n=1 Tax=Amycolatopsis sp. lyj-346 TaxID=2789289 RepID=UPI00397AB5F5